MEVLSIIQVGFASIVQTNMNRIRLRGSNEIIPIIRRYKNEVLLEMLTSRDLAYSAGLQV